MLASEACSTGILLGFCRAMNEDVEGRIKVSSFPQLASFISGIFKIWNTQ